MDHSVRGENDGKQCLRGGYAHAYMEYLYINAHLSV